MTTIDLHDSLGNLVTAHPGGAAVFERYGLDYCCHGRTSLTDACSAAGLDPVTVMTAVVAAESAAEAAEHLPYADMSPTELVDHIESTHHAYLHAELPRLIELTNKIAAVHGSRHPELQQVADLMVALHDDLEPHMAKEERVLFPLIRAMADGDAAAADHCGGIANPIARMRVEHDAAGDLLLRLREVTNGYEVPADGCASYQAAYQGLARMEADTHLHIHKENNVLFPAVDDSGRPV